MLSTKTEMLRVEVKQEETKSDRYQYLVHIIFKVLVKNKWKDTQTDTDNDILNDLKYSHSDSTALTKMVMIHIVWMILSMKIQALSNIVFCFVKRDKRDMVAKETITYDELNGIMEGDELKSVHVLMGNANDK